ncbi:hypothetical protein HUT08_19760 [Streptomyces buecherae]|uniref:Tyr recombinase domain-containing protein n=1 Tax=Streptomyces buecherae TaxID=2763006 RepID=A0A7H8NA52_9ACTN|nr:hypothetical protein HUT08_19760 [Streptomyces buecherae]
MDELAKRRQDVEHEPVILRISRASPELTTGRRVTGDPKSEAGKRLVVLPGFLYVDVRRHLDWFAEKAPDGLLFVGERGAPFRRSTFGRKWHKARTKVGLPENFRFYDLRPTGNTLATQSGATLKDVMVRAGQSSEKAALIYQHSTLARQKEVANGLDARVRAERQHAADKEEDMQPDAAHHSSGARVCAASESPPELQPGADTRCVGPGPPLSGGTSVAYRQDLCEARRLPTPGGEKGVEAR